MALRIASNIASIQAQRRLAEGTSALSQTFERLSSGQRINRASDDAASLSVAAGLGVGRVVYSAAARNLNDGISLLHIADSALVNLSQIVTRIRELAQQAVNGTFSASQREAIHKEASELEKEYLRISRETSFNGLHLFDGSVTNGLRVQAGFGAEGSIQSTLGRGLGTGTFDSRVTFATETGIASSRSNAVAHGDLNGDGIPDLVTAGFVNNGSNQGQASVLLGSGNGTFNSGGTYATATGTSGSSCDIALADLNQDGILDLVTAGWVNNGGIRGQASVFLGRGDGTFGSGITYTTETGSGAGQSLSVTVGDLNGDGILDLVTAGYANNGSAQGQASVLLGRGDGTFGARATYATDTGSTSGYTYAVTLGDVNRDGILDLVTAGRASNGSTQGQASVLLGRGDGSFGSRATYATETGTGLGRSYAVTLGDLNGDGILDLVTSGYTDSGGFRDQTSVLLGRGDGTFSSKVTYTTLSGTTSIGFGVTVGDVNGDGILDLVTAGYVHNGSFQGQAGVLLGRGDGSFNSALTFATDTASGSSGRSRAVALFDANGDGILDLVTAGDVTVTIGRGQVSVLTNISREGVSPLLPFSLKAKADAIQALAPLDRKLAQLAAQRGVIGAFQSRLTAATGALQSTVESYASAESRIRDADVASETAQLTRLQIAQQAAAAVLAQANQDPLLAIQLLKPFP